MLALRSASSPTGRRSNPFRLEQEDEVHRERLQELLVDELYSRSLAAVTALLLVLPLIQRVLAPAWGVGPAVAGAFYLLVATVVLRLTLMLVVRWYPTFLPQARHRRWLFCAGASLVAAALATIHLTTVPYLDETRMALLAVCVAGINAVGMVSMAGSLTCYFLYAVPSLGSFAVAVALRDGNGVGHLLVLMLVIFLGGLVTVASNVHLGLRRTLLLQLKLQDLALRDDLTGLRNRRSLEERMSGEEERILATWDAETGQRRPLPRESVGLLVVDLDLFKAVNDVHGHTAGDEGLRQLAGELRRVVRPPDLVVRWGGEEFVVVVRDRDRRIVAAVAERVRRTVEEADFVLPGGESLRLTCSVGWALFPFSTAVPAALKWRDVLDLADAALRAAKAAGRNRVVGLVAGPGFDADPRGGKRRAETAPVEAEVEGLVEVLVGGPDTGPLVC
jgi:diguanylate cyclase (GGDEF)-like protein